MTKEDRDIQRKLKVLRHAEKIGDVYTKNHLFLDDICFKLSDSQHSYIVSLMDNVGGKV